MLSNYDSPLAPKSTIKRNVQPVCSLTHQDALINTNY